MKTLLLALTITLVPVKAKVPQFKRVGTEQYRAVNPFLRPVTFVIECVGDYEIVTVTVPAGSAQDLDIRDPSGHPAMCTLIEWK